MVRGLQGHYKGDWQVTLRKACREDSPQHESPKLPLSSRKVIERQSKAIQEARLSEQQRQASAEEQIACLHQHLFQLAGVPCGAPDGVSIYQGSSLPEASTSNKDLSNESSWTDRLTARDRQMLQRARESVARHQIQHRLNLCKLKSHVNHASRLAAAEAQAVKHKVFMTAQEWQTQEHMLHAAQAVRHEHMSALQIPYRQHSRESLNTESDNARVLDNSPSRKSIRPGTTDRGKHVALGQSSLSERLKALQTCTAQRRAKKTPTATPTEPRRSGREATRLATPLKSRAGAYERAHMEGKRLALEERQAAAEFAAEVHAARQALQGEALLAVKIQSKLTACLATASKQGQPLRKALAVTQGCKMK